MPNFPRTWLAAEEEWGGMSMLDGIDSCRPQVAAMMAGVKRGLDTAGQGGLDKHGVAFAFASIPLVRKVASMWLVPSLVSLQPLYGPEGEFLYCKFDGTAARHTCVCRTRPIRDAVLPPVPTEDPTNKDALAALSRAIEKNAAVIADSLDEEVITDLYRTATTVVDGPADLLSGVDAAREGISRRLDGPAPNWAVTTLETANEVGLEVVPDQRYGRAEIGDIQVYVDMRRGQRVLPPRTMLVGRLGDEFWDSGYFFCPWLLVSGAPVEGLPKSQIYIRYSKNMLSGRMNDFPRGTGYYARIVLNPGTKLGSRSVPVQEARKVDLADMLAGDEWGEDDVIAPDGAESDWSQGDQPLDGEPGFGYTEDGGSDGVSEEVPEDGAGVPVEAEDAEGPGGPASVGNPGGPDLPAEGGGDGPGVPGEEGLGEGQA